MPPEPKTCASCGRRIEWRRKWERDWDQIRYCSTSCRRRGVTDVDRALEQTLLALLGERGARSADPAGATRRVGADRPAGATEDLREPARRAARRLVADGVVEAVQGGRVVDPSTVRGDFVVRRARA